MPDTIDDAPPGQRDQIPARAAAAAVGTTVPDPTTLLDRQLPAGEQLIVPRAPLEAVPC